MDIGKLREIAQSFQTRLDEKKAALAGQNIPWYPYGTLSNLDWLDKLLVGDQRDVAKLFAGGAIADIGAADGDVAFLLDAVGQEVDIVDFPPTNYNGCRGAHALKDAFGARVQIREVDLDQRFELPRTSYSFAFFLGILYHLKNPYGAMEALARHARMAVVSTRIARFNAPPGATARTELARMPLAYLLDPDECNNDATNFWIFSEAGLRRLIDRTGWDVVSWITVGDVAQSDPASPDHDERAFCLLQSRVCS